MGFNYFIGKILSDLWFNIFIYVMFLIGYLSLFKKRIWSVIDPLFLQVISMGSAAYCVYILTFYNLIEKQYTFSFIITEISFMLGFFIVKNLKKNRTQAYIEINFSITELGIFVWTSALIYFISQVLTFLIIGVVLFKNDTNHLFAFQEHSILRVFLTYSRVIFLISIFYKKHILGRFTILESIFIIFTIICTILGGSKSALLTFFALYFIVNFIYSMRRCIPFYKINTYLLIALICSAILIVSVQNKGSYVSSIISLYYRFIGSGDVFVLGYDDNVIKSIHETSGLKYIFYPGFGTALKLITNIEAPHIIGVDITHYYTGKTDSGPNARHNYIAFLFWRNYGFIFSFICGFMVSWVRNKLIFSDRRNTQFLYFIIIALSIYSITDLISDANLFMNNIVWSFLMVFIIYCCSSFLSGLFLVKVNSENSELVA